MNQLNCIAYSIEWKFVTSCFRALVILYVHGFEKEREKEREGEVGEREGG